MTETFKITASKGCDCCAPVVEIRKSRNHAIIRLTVAVYRMIKANARLDTRQGHRVMNRCEDAETLDRVTIRLLGDWVTFEKVSARPLNRIPLGLKYYGKNF